MHSCLNWSLVDAWIYLLMEVKAPPKADRIELFSFLVIWVATLLVPQYILLILSPKTAHKSTNLLTTTLSISNLF